MKSYYLLALPALLLAACSNDDGTSADSQPGRIQVSAELAKSSVTRAIDDLQDEAIVLDDESAPKSGLGIFLFEKTGETTQSTTAYSAISNTAVTKIENGAMTFTGSTALYFPANRHSINAYVYAPRNNNYTFDQNNFSVQANQTTAENYLASDLLWGSKEIAYGATGDDAKVTLTHKLARVYVTLANGTGVDASQLVGATIKLVNVQLGTTINLSTGSVGTATGTATTSASPLSLSTTETGKLRGYAVLPPQTIVASTADVPLIEVTLAQEFGGQTFVFKLSQDGNDNANTTQPKTAAFEAGKTTQYSLTLSTKGLYLTSSNITGWTPKDVVSVSAELQ